MVPTPRRLLLTASVLALLALPGLGVTASLRAGFEAGYDADQSQGAPQATTAGAVARVKDRFGTSLVVGPGSGTCAYAVEKNLDPSQGALIAWLQPAGWKPAGPGPLALLRARHGADTLALWWQPQGMTLAFSRTLAGKTQVVTKPGYDWLEPSWRHVVLSWTPEGLAMYVDGQPAQPATGAVGATPPAPDGTIVLGGDFGPGATLAVRAIDAPPDPLAAEAVQDLYRVAVSGRVEHERPVITVGPCGKPPTIDGTLAPGEWDMAAGTVGFVEIGTGTLSSIATQVRLSYDATSLYVAFRCPFTDPLAGAKLERDSGSPWDDDCVELFLQPEVGFTGKYFHLVLNAFGGLWDAEDHNAGWNMGGQWATTRDKGVWTAELSIPHASLGTLPPSEGTTWQANLCRSIGPGATTNRHTAWAFTGEGGYAVWQRFGALRFSTHSAVGALQSLMAVPDQPLEHEMALLNPSDAVQRVTFELTCYRAGTADEAAHMAMGPAVLAPGASQRSRPKIAVGRAFDQVRIRVRDVRQDKVVFAQMVRAGALAPLPAAVAAPSAAGAAAAPPLTNELLGQVIRERALWENNRLGITDKVPPPWTPMTVTGKSVQCWGRAYDYTGSLFPRAVLSQGSDLLAGPIGLSLATGGKTSELAAATAQTLTAAPHQADVDALTTTAGIKTRVRSHLEYDGCIKVELTLTPESKPVVVDELELRIPVKPERALYYHWFEATRDPRLTNAGALPAAGLKSHFKPLLWLGDDDRGLCWFSESPKGWASGDPESVLQVERGAGACTMRIRMVGRPLVIAGPWTTVFGLMATPTRPMPAGWRDWLIGLNQSNPWGAWSSGFFNNLSGTDDPGTLMAKDPPALKRTVAQWQTSGQTMPYLAMREPMKVIPYSQIVFWSGKYRDGMPAPEIKVFGPEWSNQKRPPGPRSEPDERIPLKEYYWVCPASSFAQFYIYYFNRLLDESGIDGIYIDGPWNTCANPLHGCGYLDDQGVWRAEFKIWAFRDLLKRMYCLLYEKRKDPIIHHHTSCWLCIPSISFSHMMLDGEQYHDAGQKVEDHFMDIVPLDKWRAEHTGRQWGPAPFLLPDIPGQWCKPAAPTRELLMLTNLHDTGIFPAGNNTRLVMRNYQARRLFGVAACDFRGYWGNHDWVKCETPECHVSVYRQPDGSRCLLVVGNTTKADATVVVVPQFAGLKLAGGAVTDAVDIESGEKLPLVDGRMVLPVKARDFRLIALPGYAPPPITAGDLRATALKAIPNPGFENAMVGWSTVPVEGNTGSISLDTTTRFSGNASCHLHKVAGPGGMMIQTEDVFSIEPGKKYRTNCQLRIANSTGAKAYWMISMLDAEGNTVGTNNLFAGFLEKDQDFKPLPFEFQPLAGTAVIRVHFLVAFPGVMDAWVDDFSLEEVK